jgi:hypothetical protein
MSMEHDAFEEFRNFCLKIHKAEARPIGRKCTTLDQVLFDAPPLICPQTSSSLPLLAFC